MLHDSRRDRFPTLVRFIAWLRTMPADEKYWWINSHDCPCARFFGTKDWLNVENRNAFRSEGVDLNVIAVLANPWTYGALLARAEERLEKISQKEFYFDR